MRTCSRLLVGLALLAVVTLVSSGSAYAGGMEDVLGGVGKDVEGQGKGEAAPAKEGEKPAGDKQPVAGEKPAEGEKAGARADAIPIEQRIALAEKQVAEMKNMQEKGVPPINTLEEARGAVKTMRETRDKMRADLDAADRDATRQAAARYEEFENQWAKVLDQCKPLTMDDLRQGKKPEGMDAVAWAGLCDRFASESARLAADLAATRRKLDAKRKAELAKMDNELLRAAQWLKQWEEWDAGLEGSAKRLVQGEMGRRTHAAALAAAERALADLKRLQAERKGQKSDREDPLAKEIYKGSGFWMADAIKNKVLRDMTLADCTEPPKTRPDDPKYVLGDPPPDWFKPGFTAVDRQRARVEWINEQLRLAHMSLAGAENELRTRDAAWLANYKEELENADREEGKLDNAYRVAKRKNLLVEKAKQIESTFKKRLEKLHGRYAEDVRSYNTSLSNEAKELDKMEKEAAQKAKEREGEQPAGP